MSDTKQEDVVVQSDSLEPSKGIVEAHTEVEKKRLEKKEKVIEYLRHLPVYKWAAASAGINEDTLAIWRKEDEEFSVRCESAKSEAIKGFAKRATPDFMLKSTDPATFKDRVDVTSDGKRIETNTIVFSNFTNDTKS